MKEENEAIIKALNIYGRVPETYELLNEIERLNNKIKEQSLLLIEFQDMEQRLKEKDNIINELERESYLGMIENTANNDYSKGLNIAYEYINNKVKELKGSDKDD